MTKFLCCHLKLSNIVNQLYFNIKLKVFFFFKKGVLGEQADKENFVLENYLPSEEVVLQNLLPLLSHSL